MCDDPVTRVTVNVLSSHMPTIPVHTIVHVHAQLVNTSCVLVVVVMGAKPLTQRQLELVHILLFHVSTDFLFIVLV